jgi:hypothetical protein
MSTLRLATIATIAGVLVLAAAPAASANPWGEVNCDVEPRPPECQVVAIDPGNSGSGSGGSTAEPVCRIDGQVMPCHDPALGWLDHDGCYRSPAPEVGPGAHWWKRWCYDAANDTFYSGGWTWSQSPPASAQHPVQRAIDRLTIPPPAIAASPALTSPQLVHVPVWWWIEPGWWNTRTATASIPALTITARATPTHVTWYPGDGTSLTCTGPGTPWTANRDPAEPSPTCGHTYTTSSRTSPGGAYTLRAVVTWQVSWSGGGMNGTIPAITTSSTTQITVTELRSVVTG